METSRSLVTAVGLLVALSASSCRKRPAGTCAEDIDCPAGYDCRAGACAQRAPVPGATPERVPAPELTAPGEPAPAPTTAFPVAPGPADASVPTDGAASTARTRRKAQPPSPSAPPPATPTRPPEGPLPMWKQRLKNS